jgi:hypothetical protein
MVAKFQFHIRNGYLKIPSTTDIIYLEMRFWNVVVQYVASDTHVMTLYNNLFAVQNLYSTKSFIFWDITSRIPLKFSRRFGGTCRIHLYSLLPTCFLLVSCSAYYSILKMEATYSSETSVHIQRTTQRIMPEDGILHNHRCENLISYIRSLV